MNRDVPLDWVTTRLTTKGSHIIFQTTNSEERDCKLRSLRSNNSIIQGEQKELINNRLSFHCIYKFLKHHQIFIPLEYQKG